MRAADESYSITYQNKQEEIILMKHLLGLFCGKLRIRPYSNEVRPRESKHTFDLRNILIFLSLLQTWKAGKVVQKSSASSGKGAAGEQRLRRRVVEAVPIIASLKTSCFVCPRVIKQLDFYITLVKINKEHIWASHRFSH